MDFFILFYECSRHGRRNAVAKSTRGEYSYTSGHLDRGAVCTLFSPTAIPLAKSTQPSVDADSTAS